MFRESLRLIHVCMRNTDQNVNLGPVLEMRSRIESKNFGTWAAAGGCCGDMWIAVHLPIELPLSVDRLFHLVQLLLAHFLLLRWRSGSLHEREASLASAQCRSDRWRQRRGFRWRGCCGGEWNGRHFHCGFVVVAKQVLQETVELTNESVTTTTN